MWGSCRKSLILLLFGLIGHLDSKPTVNPGLFMILGVNTCRDGSGYCLLGLDCTLDEDFLPDDSGGHCDGLKKAFTPSAHFTCCKVNPDATEITTTKRPRPYPVKPITTLADSTAIESTTAHVVSSTTDIANDTTTIVGLDELLDNSSETTTSDNSVQITDVFVDVNNEVFKEVIPPVLQEMDSVVQTEDQ